MAFDGMMVYGLTAELKQALEQGRINKIYQPFERELLFHIRAQGKNQKLLLSANPTYPRAYLTEQTFPNPDVAPMFCMLLRKHLEGGVIEKIEQDELERTITFHVRSRDELGDMHQKQLVIEIMGRHSNILLIDPVRQVMMDGIHHVTPSMSAHRAVLPGRAYIAPPDQGKLNPFHCDQETFYKKINFNLGKLDQQIVQSFSGVSPLLAKEILYNAGLPNRENLWQSFQQMIQRIQQQDYEPAIMVNQGKEYFYLFPLDHLNNAPRDTYRSVSAMLDAFFADKAERDLVKQQAGDLLRFIQNEKNKNIKKLKKLHQTLTTSQEAEQYKLFGELITAYMHTIKQGMTEAQVVNYYDEAQAEITIPLLPEKSPNDNAQRYFKLYQKAKTSEAMMKEQIEKAEAELKYFEQLELQMEQASILDIEQIREELEEEGYFRVRRHKRLKKKKSDKLEIATYYSTEGLPIQVGKNNKQNDFLTNRLARSHDTWLHTKDIPGSHVVIRSDRFSDETLLEAAQLAAYFSKARLSSQVPVDYTLVKHVKKPSGAKPGYVIYEQQQTVYVKPDEAIVKRLKGQLQRES